MSYPKTEAPYTEAGYVDSSPVIFNLTEMPDGILLSWTNTPFSPDGTRPATIAAVGKEYGTVDAPYQITNAEMQDLAECPTQSVACIPSPTGQPGDWDRSRCFTGIFDTPVAFLNGMLTTPYTPVWEIFIPYNKFSANRAAVQTDGKESQYYVELTSVGGNILKTKWIFKYTSPLAPFDACGIAPSVPLTPSGTTPADPGKGHGKPPKK